MQEIERIWLLRQYDKELSSQYVDVKHALLKMLNLSRYCNSAIFTVPSLKS